MINLFGMSVVSVLALAAAPGSAAEFQAPPFAGAAFIEVRLVAQARSQIEISRRDHDERLKTEYAALAKRSCASPGSVAQAELDRLPEPYGEDFDATRPGGLDACETFVYLALGRGVDAEKIRRLSMSEAAINVDPDTKAAPAVAVQTIAFVQMLPEVRQFAAASCRTPGRVRLPANIVRSRDTIFFAPAADDAEIDRLSAGLQLCELRLFRRLISVIEFGTPQNITGRWIQDVVREYTP
jgi:hypothetical protein